MQVFLEALLDRSHQGVTAEGHSYGKSLFSHKRDGCLGSLLFEVFLTEQSHIRKKGYHHCCPVNIRRKVGDIFFTLHLHEKRENNF